jgi:uncharacterized protein with FMN-binding domain
MDKSGLSLLATILGIFGTAVLFGHPAWGTFTGIAILILAGGIAGTLAAPSKGGIVERKAAGQKISNSLVTVSSAAILAIYAAGYQRTRSAEDKFEAQTVRRSTAAPIAAGAAAPTATAPASGATLAIPRPLVLSPGKKTVRPSSTTVRKTSPPLTPTDHSQATPSEPPTTATTAADPGAEPTASLANTPGIRYKDGTYLGWGSCRHGDIQASVLIQGGQIVSTTIAQCLTRYSCAWIDKLPGQVVTRQSPKVDFVSGATESSDAFSDAITAALATAHE